MSALGFGYRREGDQIFCGDSRIRKAAPATFTVLTDIWARDAHRVYFRGREQRKAHAASFRHGLRLILNWWHCMPDTALPRVEALLAELSLA